MEYSFELIAFARNNFHVKRVLICIDIEKQMREHFESFPLKTRNISWSKMIEINSRLGAKEITFPKNDNSKIFECFATL
jgi:hypothetical protein